MNPPLFSSLRLINSIQQLPQTITCILQLFLRDGAGAGVGVAAGGLAEVEDVIPVGVQLGGGAIEGETVAADVGGLAFGVERRGVIGQRMEDGEGVERLMDVGHRDTDARGEVARSVSVRFLSFRNRGDSRNAEKVFASARARNARRSPL